VCWNALGTVLLSSGDDGTVFLWMGELCLVSPTCVSRFALLDWYLVTYLSDRWRRSFYRSLSNVKFLNVNIELVCGRPHALKLRCFKFLVTSFFVFDADNLQCNSLGVNLSGPVLSHLSLTPSLMNRTTAFVLVQVIFCFGSIGFSRISETKKFVTNTTNVTSTSVVFFDLFYEKKAKL